MEYLLAFVSNSPGFSLDKHTPNALYFLTVVACKPMTTDHAQLLVKLFWYMMADRIVDSTPCGARDQAAFASMVTPGPHKLHLPSRSATPRTFTEVCW